MAIDTVESPARRAPQRTPPPGRGALAGVVAVFTALAVTELAAGLVPGVPSLVDSVGGVVIDGVPGPVKDFAIAVFGLYDKLALLVGIAVLAAAFGAVLGLVALRRFAAAAAGFVVFGVLGWLAALTDPQVLVPLLPALSAVVGAAAGVGALWLALRAAGARSSGTANGAGSAGGAPPRAGDPAQGPQFDRRRFLRVSATLTAAAAVAATTGRTLSARARSAADRVIAALPRVSRPLPPPPPAASLEVPGLAPLFTPNEVFYRIDTALGAPVVDLATWRLRIHGLVDREVQLSYDQIQGLDLIEADITMACVSNAIGGGLIGNARWTGVRLRDVLDFAGVAPESSQIVARSVDGFTAGFPTAAAFDGRDALLAIGMNGEPLPLVHGFPARLVVPGLYGYVSATKWLSDLELTTWDAFDGYWVPRGWSKEGPVKTQSRIDVPLPDATVDAGPQVIAGVAWAPTRGIAGVEVSVDGGPWQQAELAAELNDKTWRQWRLPWEATPGRHTLAVRATDGTGETQTPVVTEPAPNGASGWHSINVRVR